MTTENRPSGPPEPVDDESGGEPVLYEKAEDGIAVITLHRPGVLNAINGDMTAALNEALATADADDDVRVVILRGAGRAFSAGGDITESSRRILANDQGRNKGRRARRTSRSGSWASRSSPRCMATPSASHLSWPGCVISRCWRRTQRSARSRFATATARRC